MPSSKPQINIIEELGVVLPGNALEVLADILEDPDADLSHGQLARLGAAFTALGAQITDAAKAPYYGVRMHVDAEVLFKWRNPTGYYAVDSAAVKKVYPQELRPDLYRRTEVKGSVTVELPFEVKG